MARAKPDTEMRDVGYFADFGLRVARSRGYAAGYAGKPRTGDLLTAGEVVAWNEGYDRAAATVAAPFVKPEVTNVVPSCGGVRDELRETVSAVIQSAGEHRTKTDNDGVGADVEVGSGVVAVSVEAGGTQQRVDVPSRPSPAIKSCGIVAIVDVMNLLVRAFFAGDVSAINGVRSMFETLGSVMEKLAPEYMIFALDGGHVTRTELYPDYKAHRPEKPAELVAQIKLAEQAIEAIGWPSIRVNGWEADDVMASLAVQLEDIDCATVVISSDKDMLQLGSVTRVYHPWKGGEFITTAKCQEKYGVLPGQMRDYLSLCGDKTDGIPGVTGIGEKTAAKLIGEYKTLDAILAAAANGDIPGANGKKLREQVPAARLSQQLVTLRTDLPVGFHWSDWPLHEPRAGWRQRLEALGLGIPANRLAQRLSSEGSDRGGKPSQIDIDWVQIEQVGLTTPEVDQMIAECGMTEAEAVRYRKTVAAPEAKPSKDEAVERQASLF